MGVSVAAIYDRIGGSYGATRQADPQIAALIWQALGDARSVVNVGAGAGSYEPSDREVLAIEPSELMIAQRPPGSAPALCACAEELPLADASFDAALAVNTMQHWSDVRAGLRELKRVARRRIVILARDARLAVPFWLTRDYFPALDRSALGVAVAQAIHEELGAVELVPVPVPSDCQDGLFSAYWARPEKYLDATVPAQYLEFCAGEDRRLGARPGSVARRSRVGRLGPPVRKAARAATDRLRPSAIRRAADALAG